MRVSGTPTDPDFAPEDPFVKANAVDPVAEFSAGLASQPNGTTEVDLRRTVPGLSGVNDPGRRRESGYGSVVADSFLWKARQLAAADPQIDEPTVGLTNGGGIREDILAGPINKAETFAALPSSTRSSWSRTSAASSSGRSSSVPTRACPGSRASSRTSPARGSRSTRRVPPRS